MSVPLHNGRQLVTSLDKEGMLLCEHSISHVNYFDSHNVVSLYYPEIEDYLQRVIPHATKAIVFHHQVRSWKKDAVLEGKKCMKPKDPVCFVHSDYSPQGAIARLKTLSELPSPLLSPEEAQHYSSRGDFMIVHAWRNISSQRLRQHPLALCCSDTVNESELLAYDLCYSDHREEVMAVRFRESQKWLYYKDMHRDELLVFKQFDTRGSLVAAPSSAACAPFVSCVCPHTSFLEAEEQEGTESSYPGRESIEAAVIVFLD